jgi:N-acetylmuramoyl-L-alanine amidase
MMIDKTVDSAISSRKFKAREIHMHHWGKIIVGSCLAVFAFAFLATAGGIHAAETKKVIVMDAAGGGRDWPETKKNRSAAQDIPLAVARYFKEFMNQEKDFSVILTREQNRDVDEEEKLKLIEKSKPDFFISLDVNRGFGKASSGFEIYYPDYLRDVAKPDKKSDRFQRRNKAQADSLKMARIIQENLNRLFPRKSRGIRKALSSVNQEWVAPSVGVAMGFVTNDEDRKKLLSEKTQREIAQALVKSVKAYYR